MPMHLLRNALILLEVYIQKENMMERFKMEGINSSIANPLLPGWLIEFISHLSNTIANVQFHLLVLPLHPPLPLTSTSQPIPFANLLALGCPGSHYRLSHTAVQSVPFAFLAVAWLHAIASLYMRFFVILIYSSKCHLETFYLGCSILTNHDPCMYLPGITFYI